jgi:hypothetical protein
MTLRDQNGYKFATKLPADTVKVAFITGVELYILQKGKRKWTSGNIELREGLPLFIHSVEENKYWYRRLALDHDPSMYRKYIKDGNLYIHFDEYWKEVLNQEREAEGMGYYLYNKIRELILFDEVLSGRQHLPDYHIKKRAIQLEIEKIKNKVHKN